MRNKGFTLIELLAVIVILAIIALIATPIVIGIISSAKEESNEKSIQLYGRSIDNAVAQYRLNNPDVYLGSMSEEERLTAITPYIEYDGNKVECDTQIKNNGEVSLTNCKVEGKEVPYTYGEVEESTEEEGSEVIKLKQNGEVVYFDVATGKACDNYVEANSATGYNGIDNKTGNQNSCLKFYAYNDNGTMVNLILDHNTTAATAWITLEHYVAAGGNAAEYGKEGNNKYGPITVMNQLKLDTNGWQGTMTPSNYEYKGTTRPYTIDYSGYKARLITAQEIAQITGANKEETLNWKEEVSADWYYLDGAKGTSANWQTKVANSTNKSDYYWLFEHLNACISSGCYESEIEPSSKTLGYWTSSAVAPKADHAWKVYFSARLNQAYVYWKTDIGIRPVITISTDEI